MAAQSYLTLANNYMKTIPTNEIMPFEKLDVKLFKLLSGYAKHERFEGDKKENMIRVDQPYTGEAFWESKDMPEGDTWNYEKTTLELREIFVTSELTMQAMQRAEGLPGSWGNIIEEALKLMKIDYNWLMKVTAMGDGSGKLALVASASEAGTTGVYTLTCDNSYLEWGWENTAFIRKGMKIDIYRGANLVTADCAGLRVTSVTRGRRTAAASYAKPTGTVVFTAPTGITFADGDIIYLAGSKDKLPMGLTGIVSDGVIWGSPSTYLGLSRLTRDYMKPGVVRQATDFGSGSPTDGTPTDWDTSVITDALEELANGPMMVPESELIILTNSKLASTLYRLGTQTAGGIVLNANSPEGLNMPVVGSQYAKVFLGPNGGHIPIEVDMAIPEHVIYILHRNSFEMYDRGAPDFIRDYDTGIWEPKRNSRKIIYEAPFHGYFQMSAPRVDTMGVIMDLRTDL